MWIKIIYGYYRSIELVNRTYDVSFVNDFCCAGVTEVSLHFKHLLACLSILNDQ